MFGTDEVDELGVLGVVHMGAEGDGADGQATGDGIAFEACDLVGFVHDVLQTKPTSCSIRMAGRSSQRDCALWPWSLLRSNL